MTKMGPPTKVEQRRRRALEDPGVTRYCSKCHTVKPVIEFHKMATGRHGLRPNCKTCQLAAQRLWAAGSPTRNRDYLRERRDRLLPMWREWAAAQQAADPFWTRLRGGVSRAQSYGRPVDKFNGDDLRAYWQDNGISSERCFYTGEPLGESWEIDHVHPLSRECSPGHVMSNLVPTLTRVNRSKHSKTAEEYTATSCIYRAD